MPEEWWGPILTWKKWRPRLWFSICPSWTGYWKHCFSWTDYKNSFSNPSCLSLQTLLEAGEGRAVVGLVAWAQLFHLSQSWSWYSLYLVLPNVPALWIVRNLTTHLENISAQKKNLEVLEREIQKQNWRHRNKNRSPQAKIFGRVDKSGLIEEWIEWGKAGQYAGESEESAHCSHEDYLKHLYFAMSTLGRDQEILHPLNRKICKISVNRSVPDSRVTNLPTPPQICLITKFLFLNRVLILLHGKARPHLWCFLWNNRNRNKGWQTEQSLT